MKKRFRSALLAGVTALLFAQPSLAQVKHDATIYLWGSSLSGAATIGRQTVPVELSFSDLLDKLDAAIQAHYEGVGQQWGVGLDFTYLKISDTSPAGVEAESKTTLGEAFGIFRLNPRLDLLAGVRLMGLDMKLTVPGQAVAEGDRNLADVFGGVRVRLPLSDTFRASLRGDIGAGDSDLVWNVVALLDWQVSKSVAVRGGYRWLDYDVENNNNPIKRKLDLRMDGPFLGVGFQW